LNIGYVVGASGTILKSTDGGNTWVRQTSGTAWEFSSVYFLDDQAGWVVGQQGTILKTSNGGTTWSAQISGTTLWLRSVSFIDANTGWVAGDEGVLKTTDGGAVWVKESISPPRSQKSIHVVAQGASIFGWMVGSAGTSYKLSTDGNSWSAQDRITINDLNSVHLVLQGGNLAAWAVGASGTILKAIDQTVEVEAPKQISSIPETFALHANFPNPFNPSTAIKYDLSQQVEVQLVIFDLTGRHVRTLVNQTQQAGRYVIIWDGRNEQGEALATGLYIYQLRAGNYMHARRMALVR
jgi:photosystem II stability/assembly factor-like uncharacterized protein